MSQPTAAEVMHELEALGSEQTRKTLRKHGARDPFFGVKGEDLKPLRKRIKVNHELALKLYATGNSDAMYLASFIADPAKFSQADLLRWAKAAYWSLLSETAVASVAAESKWGWKLAQQWIEAPSEHLAATGWATLSHLVSITEDDSLEIPALSRLVNRCATSVHGQPNRVQYAMNGFVIAAGSYVAELTETALSAAQRMGTVRVNMGDTACKVPDATEYIQKVQSMKRVGKKKKSARC